MTLVQMDEDFAWSFAHGGLECGTGHGEDRRTRYRLKQVAAGFRWVAPDFDTVWSIRRLRSGFTAAAFSDCVANVGAVSDEVYAFTVLHDMRSYWGFQPRPIPFDIRLLAIQS